MSVLLCDLALWDAPQIEPCSDENKQQWAYSMKRVMDSFDQR